MLSRHGARQPLSPSRLDDAGKGSSTPSEERLCLVCLETIFGSAVTGRYKEAWAGNPRKFSMTYDRSARELWESVCVGCLWCALLGEGIVVALELDEAMET